MSCSWCILTVGLNTALTYIYNITIRRVRRAALHPHCTPSSSQPLWGSASQGNNQERGGQQLCPGVEKNPATPRRKRIRSDFIIPIPPFPITQLFSYAVNQKCRLWTKSPCKPIHHEYWRRIKYKFQTG